MAFNTGYGRGIAYNEELAERVRELLALHDEITERKMFGGIAWMHRGNMACGVMGDELIVRLEPKEVETALSEPHTGLFDFTGRPMRGFVCVGPEGIADEEALAGWVQAGVGRAASLPAK